MVEPLSPMALHDAQAAASSGFRLLLPLATVRSGADRLGTIDLPLRCASGGVLRFSTVALTGYGVLRLRSIGDNRSTMRLPRLKLTRPESDFASILGNNRLKLDSFTTLTRRPEVRQVIAKFDQAEFSASWLARHRQSSRFLDRWLVCD